MDFAVVVDLGIDLDGMHGANTRYSPEFCRLLCRFGREPVVRGGRWYPVGTLMTNQAGSPVTAGLGLYHEVPNQVPLQDAIEVI
jgi:hypothetical protein